MATNWKPGPNRLLVAVPERFERQHQPGKARLVLPTGSDDWAMLDAQLRAGEEVEIETDEVPIAVRQGLVLAVPEQLTTDCVLCAGPNTHLVPQQEAVLVNGKTVADPAGGRLLRATGRYVEQNIPRTAADITQRVEVGNTIHFDPYALSDGNEVAPGVYAVSYADVIAVRSYVAIEGTKGGVSYARQEYPYLFPIGGYVLLTRVWPEDVETDESGVKVRYNRLGLVAEINVPPLVNEGAVAWISSPLRGTQHEFAVGDTVVIDPATARVEHIAGTEYLAVRQDFILVIKVPLPILAAHVS